MSVVLLLLVTSLGAVRTLGGIWLEEREGILPSVALVAVLVTARYAPARRYRWTAVATGIASGLVIENGVLVPAIVLLLLGALARHTRLFLPVRHLRGLALLGAAYAIIEAILIVALTPVSTTDLIGGAAFLPAMIGFGLTGLLFALTETVLQNAPFLRHVLERP